VRFKLDDNLPAGAAALLGEAGHDATTVLDQNMGGESDPAIAAVCRREGQALVTLDTDFADIRTYPPAEYDELLVLRLRRQDAPHVLAVLRRILPLLDKEPLRGRLWIVGEERVRTRS
jgi:predicted nuclease of predicted toxin-antitoxin system